MVIKGCATSSLTQLWSSPVSFFLHIYNVSKVCILVVSETIWNCREIDENNVHLKHAL